MQNSPESRLDPVARRRRCRPACLVFVAAMLVPVACSRNGPPGGDLRNQATGPTPDPGSRRPDGATTGVPGGIVLQRSASIDVRHAGTVISARDVHGTIHVHADDVTIRDTRVTSNDYWPIWLDPHRRGLRVIDTDVVGSGSCQAGIGTHDFHAIRVDVRGCGDGAKAGQNTTIEGSWFHDLRVRPGSHNDGIQVSDGHHVVIRGNRVSAPVGQTSAIMIGPDFGRPISDVVVEDNWLDGGGYALHLDAHDAVVRGNRFGRSSTYGPVDLVTAPSVWTDNVWADNHRGVTP